ncbi:nonsense-mediated mRNA decay protein 3 [Fonticula alba]|uniref:60S ribosomal export protein NMD3 n=1 Tax=Fonticula alba TaxID=691883 RepID=A0A058Z6X8_FONAL|nr:nonsense-mediated mRNA decay protein 3 [Fonticula alba]KCV70029.1 nonsense-mediated mRNA decay protein 3 [Fonticula alba]|eukprot:XP_009495635.1 nonsense-mediated mRNA decay protein 3 [Fonticula alba]
MEYINVTNTQQRILCCNCGVAIPPNPANMCVDCIRNEIDITEGISKQLVIQFCSSCERYLQPPNHWVAADLESRELLSLCLKRMKGMNKVRLVDAGFIWTEPHSKRLKVKLTIQKEVHAGMILQQVFVVDFVVAGMMCEDCHRVEAKDMWRACVQVRQKVPHKRTFFYLEQLIIKHQQHRYTTNIKETPDGIDFFFANKTHASKFHDFVASVCPTRYKVSEEVISIDVHAHTANYKYTYSVEMVPICRDDLICLPRSLRAHLGNMGPLVLCSKIGNSVHLVDPNTLQIAEMSAASYWRSPFTTLCNIKSLTEYIVLDVEPLGPVRGKNVLCEMELARKSDFGFNDTTFFVRSHLGAILQPGDSCLGYDIANANFNSDHFEEYNRAELPDVIVVKKAYSNSRRKRRNRNWKLQHITNETAISGPVDKRKGPATHEDYEQFLRDLEEDFEFRSAINLYKSANQPALPVHGEESNMDTDFDDDAEIPEIDIDELLDDMAEMNIADVEMAGDGV